MSKKFRLAYDKPLKVTTDNNEPSMTEQSHKKDCDIGNILRKYDKTGLLVHVNNAVAEYGDFSGTNEYKESLNKVIQAQETFMELPSEIRKKFGNDPGNYLEFVSEPKNKEEMIKLGMIIEPKKEPVFKVQIEERETETDG